jgi:hypothetical protein
MTTEQKPNQDVKPGQQTANPKSPTPAIGVPEKPGASTPLGAPAAGDKSKPM